MHMYAVNKVEINLTVPSIEETIAWYERVHRRSLPPETRLERKNQ
jgi:hypothetical protein